MKVKSWIKKIEKHMAAVAKERDAIDEAISEMKDLKDSCNEAWRALEEARDHLSELV